MEGLSARSLIGAHCVSEAIPLMSPHFACSLFNALQCERGVFLRLRLKSALLLLHVSNGSRGNSGLLSTHHA